MPRVAKRRYHDKSPSDVGQVSLAFALLVESCPHLSAPSCNCPTVVLSLEFKPTPSIRQTYTNQPNVVGNTHIPFRNVMYPWIWVCRILARWSKLAGRWFLQTNMGNRAQGVEFSRWQGLSVHETKLGLRLSLVDILFLKIFSRLRHSHLLKLKNTFPPL